MEGKRNEAERLAYPVPDAAATAGVGCTSLYGAIGRGELPALVVEDNGTPNDGRDVVDGVDLISGESNAPTDEDARCGCVHQ